MMEFPDPVDFLVGVLQPLEFVAWGQLAMGRLGVPCVANSIMLIPSNDNELSLAINKLEGAGFCHAPWSYGSCAPEIIETSDKLRRIHAKIGKEYAMLDAHSTRFQFPPEIESFKSIKLVLLQSDYVQLALPREPQQAKDLTRDGIFYYPNKLTLLESVIRTLLKEEKYTRWKTLLKAWAISFICGYLDVELDALDSCPDNSVKEWFNEAIRRDKGGLDKSITKRTGRMPPKESSNQPIL